jgi:predicted Rossmann fold nucleotide-binding protein DprA/Smf involved in DNA uptake
MLIRLGAALVRDNNDILELLGLRRRDENPTLVDVEEMSGEEKVFIKLLEVPRTRDELIRLSKLDTGTASAVLSLLEIKGLIKEELGEVRKTF